MLSTSVSRLAMTEPSITRQIQAAAVLTEADRIVTELKNDPFQPIISDKRIGNTSFLIRLAAALLLESDFPALPDGFDCLLERDRARAAAPHLASLRVLVARSHTQKAKPMSLPRPNRGASSTDMDHCLAAQTAATLQDLRATRLDLLNEYLELSRANLPGDNAPDTSSYSVALLDCYWRSRRRLLGINSEPHPKSLPPKRRPNVRSYLRRPPWEHDITWELWRLLDHRYLLWTDPEP